VINISRGWSWGTKTPPINSATSPGAQNVARAQGKILVSLLNVLEATGYHVPLLVTSAGNSAGQPAVWNSAWNNAALDPAHLHQSIIVVEAVANQPGGIGGATLSSFSNIGGHISAPGGEFPPGQQIFSTGATLPYLGMQGTSMAAPHVAGLVSYLFSIDPTLTHAQIRQLLVDNAVAVAGGASPRIDAFATVMDIDRVRGSNLMLRMLLDIDDGTEDGNRRTAPDADFADYTETDADNDTGVGDGNIDMSDFRRWRDGYLALAAVSALDLDGSDTHPKKDLNGNGKTKSAGDDESVYPFVDLNGDTHTDLQAAARVPGYLNNREVTDLDVLQELFDDPHYGASDLDDLVMSADIAIRPGLLNAGDAAQIHSSVRPAGTEEAEDDPKFRRNHTGSVANGEGLWQVYTVPVVEAGYTARVIGLNAQGDTTFDEEKHFSAEPGQDHFWDPPPTVISLDVVRGYGPGVEAGVGGLSCSRNWDIFEGPVSPTLTFENSPPPCSASGVDPNTGAVLSAEITGSTSYAVVTSTGTTAGNLSSVQLKADLTGSASGAPGQDGEAGSGGRLEVCFAVAAGVSLGWQISGSVQAGDRGVTIVELSGSGVQPQRIEGASQAISLSGRLDQGSYCMEMYYVMNLETSAEESSIQQALHSIATLTFVP
jgi:hypothetical protein